jgi:hypothetical protein
MSSSSSQANMVAAPAIKFQTLPTDKSEWLTKYKIQAIAESEANGFLGHLEGTARPVANLGRNATFDEMKYHDYKVKQFKEDKAKAWRFLVQITSDNLSSLLTPHAATRDPAPVWAAIVAEYEQNAEDSQQTALYDRLRNLKYIDTGDIKDDLRKLTNSITVITNALASLPAPDTSVLSDSQKKSTLERALAQSQHFDQVLPIVDSIAGEMTYALYVANIEKQVKGIKKRSFYLTTGTAADNKSKQYKNEQSESKALFTAADTDDIDELQASYTEIKKNKKFI